MTTAESFPQALLAQPAAARLAYFQTKVVAHPHLKDTHRALWHVLHHPTEASLVLVVGPTGVGKTTLRRRIETQVLEEMRGELEQDRGRIPVVGVEAVAPESGNFNWKDYYLRVLAALDEPLLAHKVADEVGRLPRDGGRRLGMAHGANAAALRRALEHGLHHRRVTAVLVDEAQHFTKMASGRRLLDQMDTLKSLASLTGTLHVLLGTYEVLDLADLSAQLSRRSVVLHFPRYRRECAADRVAFKSVLLTFQRHLPLTEEPDLVGREEYFYEGCAGCVGVLKAWLQRALGAALADDQATLSVGHLDRQRIPTRTLLRLARESQAGEAALTETVGERTELRRQLGLATEPGIAVAPPTAPAARPSTGRVGQRRPTRDPVGSGEHDG
mgnify:CR=1 FL=1